MACFMLLAGRRFSDGQCGHRPYREASLVDWVAVLAPIEAGLADSKFVVAAQEMLAFLVVIETGRE